MQTPAVLGIDTTGLNRNLSVHDPLSGQLFPIGTVTNSGFSPITVDLGTIDASKFVTAVSFADGANASPGALAAYDQSAGMALLSAAVEARVKSIQSKFSFNQYYRGVVDVVFPPGVIPLASGVTMFAGRVRYRGRGTVFAKVGTDYGDMLRFRDISQEPNNGVYVRGNSELHDFSAIDLTATTHGGLIIVDNFEFGLIDNLHLHNGFENLVVQGCNNTKFSNVVSRSDEKIGAGTGVVPGSTLLSLRTAYNGDVEFFNCTFAGGNIDTRYTKDAILIQSADVVTFIGGELGCVDRSTIHINNVMGLSNQAVKVIGANLDNGTKCQVFVDGYTGTAFGQNSLFDSAFFGTDVNFVNIQNPAFFGANFRMNATGAPKEAIVCKGYSCTFEGKIRGVGTSATADKQYSAIWMAGNVNTVRNMNIEGSATKSLAYAVEAATGYYGQSVQSSVFVPGANATAGVSYNDGSIYTGDINCVGGAPVQAASSSAARTTPTVIT